MQRYLNLFSGVEAAFHRCAQEIAATTYTDGAARVRECEQRIAEPLRVCARLLEQEYKRKQVPRADEVYLFRLGELILLCSALATKLPELASLVLSLIHI